MFFSRSKNALFRGKFALNFQDMAVSSIDKELIKYFVQLTDQQKQSLIQMIKTFLQSGSSPAEKVSIEQYNKELDDAMERINSGHFTLLEELEKEMQSW
jgi:hypothetical protein